jgi:hypothetical protein
MINYKPPLPSSLLVERTDEDFNYKKSLTTNQSLKVGVVLDIIEVDDVNNVSKLSTEYKVMTVEKQNNNVYNNCLAVDSFGGISDYCNKKLRATQNKDKASKKNDLKKQNGSIVLLLCLDGTAEQAVIIGSLAHPDRKNGKLTKELGHHMEGEFNGVNWKVDKDGALTVTFKSATDNDGKPADEKAGGATIKMEKDGSIEAADGNKEKIRIDKTKKTIDITAEADISSTSDANVNLTAKKNISAKATADLLADAGGSFTAKSGGAFNVTSEGPMSLKAPDMKITVDNMLQIKASTISMSAPSIMVGDGGTPAIILNTQALGLGNLGMPVVSTFIGPFSSTVFIAP